MTGRNTKRTLALLAIVAGAGLHLGTAHAQLKGGNPAGQGAVQVRGAGQIWDDGQIWDLLRPGASWGSGQIWDTVSPSLFPGGGGSGSGGYCSGPHGGPPRPCTARPSVGTQGNVWMDGGHGTAKGGQLSVTADRYGRDAVGIGCDTSSQ